MLLLNAIPFLPAQAIKQNKISGADTTGVRNGNSSIFKHIVVSANQFYVPQTPLNKFLAHEHVVAEGRSLPKCLEMAASAWSMGRPHAITFFAFLSRHPHNLAGIFSPLYT
jgi:hypothetical protein